AYRPPLLRVLSALLLPAVVDDCRDAGGLEPIAGRRSCRVDNSAGRTAKTHRSRAWTPCARARRAPLALAVSRRSDEATDFVSLPGPADRRAEAAVNRPRAHPGSAM